MLAGFSSMVATIYPSIFYETRCRLDLLRLELEVARENDYDFMQGRIEHEIDRIQRELVEGIDVETPEGEG
jgi:hypothetical protein